METLTLWIIVAFFVFWTVVALILAHKVSQKGK